MALSKTRIHQIELLLTLDYLLRFTDEKHPATQIKICEYAKKYGLKFDKKSSNGNEVRRQRVGDCLNFLSDVSEKYPDDFPFVLEKTNSGKFYLEQRNGLNTGQVAKILAAIKNDKYTKNEDVSFLIDRVLSTFSTSKLNAKEIEDESNMLIKGVKKPNKETMRKIDLIEKAFKFGKMIKIKFSITDTKTQKTNDYYYWYKVYLIKEFSNKLYAFMLPIGQINPVDNLGSLKFKANYIFEPIENINIPNEPEKDILFEDLNQNRDFNKLFGEACPELAKKYGTVDEMLKYEILPKGGNINIVSFYFNIELKDIIKRSFENYFNEEFRYQETNIIKGLENEFESLFGEGGNWTIVADEVEDSEKQVYGLANISVDSNSFKSWLLSDPYGEGKVCISDLITIIKPSSVNKELAEYYCSKLINKYQYLSERSKKILLMQNEIASMKEQESVSNNTSDTTTDDTSDDISEKLNTCLITKKNFFLKGLKGFGISFRVKTWLEKNKDSVDGFYIDCSELDLYMDTKRTMNDLTLHGQLFTPEQIDKLLSLHNVVAVADNFQDLTNFQKQHILLLCDGYVVDGRVESGFRKIENLEFVCAINYPEFEDL